jgi:DNA polymerase-3 subunit delta'
VVGADGELPLPWLADPLRQALAHQRAHAVLLHGPQGVGQFELALSMAQAWLCEAAVPAARIPCGICASCRLCQSHSHPDLLVLLPESLSEALGWGPPEGEEGASEKAAKTKPSKEIKVGAVRTAVGFAQTTSARGRTKVLVVHPAERMNAIAANTLLKTLEEPPGNARFVLSCAAPDALLPTIRSRCQSQALGLPPTAVAIAWLAGRSVDRPDVMLAAAGGAPLEVLDWVAEGIDAGLWLRLPALVAQGDAAPVSGWALPRLVDALQKLCHDTMCRAVGAAPRYFPATSLAQHGDLAALGEWARELRRVARHAEHSWNAPLMAEALMQQGRQVLSSATKRGTSKRTVSVHSDA